MTLLTFSFPEKNGDSNTEQDCYAKLELIFVNRLEHAWNTVSAMCLLNQDNDTNG